MKRLKGTSELIFDAVETVTNLVERTEKAAGRRTVRRFVPSGRPTEVAEAVLVVKETFSATTYGSIRLINNTVRLMTQAGLSMADSQADADGEATSDEAVTPMCSDAAGTLPWLLDHAESVLNGVVGDHLAARDNALALDMTLRKDGAPIQITPEAIRAAWPAPSRRVAVFVHGLTATEWSWTLGAEKLWGDPTTTLGSRLEAQEGLTSLYIRYNTGLHISTNGLALSTLLDELVAAWPVPLEEISLIGHSMGGLVVRGAAHRGDRDAATWVRALRHVICLGSPHLGAPLEKIANATGALLEAIDAAGAQVPAEVLRARSAGIKDLRFGYTSDEEWRGKDPDALLEDHRLDLPLVDGVAYYALGATLTHDTEHPAGKLIGDWLVRTPSATGQAPTPLRRVPFRTTQVVGGLTHNAIVNHPDVYAFVRDALEGDHNNLPTKHKKHQS